MTRIRLSSRFSRAILVPMICAAWTMAAPSAVSEDSGKQAKPNREAEHCRSIKDERARTRCKEKEKANEAEKPSEQQSPGDETWRLARTRNPGGGPDTVSITKSADADRSDADFSGLMLRCTEGATTAVLVVLAKPLKPRAQPKVKVVAGPTTTELTGSAVTPGALVLLPEKASALIENAWQSVPELEVTIEADRRSLHGVVVLTEIGNAMQTLQSHCPK